MCLSNNHGYKVEIAKEELLVCIQCCAKFCYTYLLFCINDLTQKHFRFLGIMLPALPKKYFVFEKSVKKTTCYNSPRVFFFSGLSSFFPQKTELFVPETTVK